MRVQSPRRGGEADIPPRPVRRDDDDFAVDSRTLMPWLGASILPHREAQTNAHRAHRRGDSADLVGAMAVGDGGVHIAPEHFEHTGIDTRVM